jgi:hypothetical protein
LGGGGGGGNLIAFVCFDFIFADVAGLGGGGGGSDTVLVILCGGGGGGGRCFLVWACRTILLLSNIANRVNVFFIVIIFC